MCVMCGGTCTLVVAEIFKYKDTIINFIKYLLCLCRIKRCSYKCKHLKIEGKTTKYHSCIYSSDNIKCVDLHDICCRT